ncbi:MAG: hypothetical protein ABIH46_07115 [Chloroflexota bacterium]
MATAKVRVCICCGRYLNGDTGWYCHNCLAKITAEKRRRMKPKPVKYLHYRGQWVGVFDEGVDTEGETILKPRYLGYFPMSKDKSKVKSKFPLAKTLNLDVYIPGFTRDQIKRLKATVARLSAVTLGKSKKR